MILQQCFEEFPRLVPVAGKINPHPGNSAHGGDILGGMMSHSQGSVADAAADAHQLDVGIGTGKQHPSFKAGDTITVAYRIVEGNKERVQLYRGVVIKIAGHGDKKRFTVRKMSGTVGVERIFPLESPAIDSITVNKVGKVRRAKLYYLRALTGKKARIQEKRVNA